MTIKSPARRAQQKHWETLGQISSMIGLCNYILNHNPYLPEKVKIPLKGARQCLLHAATLEARNNQFINTKLPRGF
jgi:hypothetical protein